MADLNALIAQGVQFQAPPNPFAQYAQMQQLQQGEQANQLNQMKMQEYERGLQEQNRLRSVVSQPGFDPMNPTHQASAYSAAPTLAPGFIKEALATRETIGKIGKVGAETADLEYKNKVTKANRAISDISALSSPKEAIDSINAHLAAGDITPEKADAIKNSLGAAPSFAAWQRGMVTGILDAKERLTMTAPKPVAERLGNVVKYFDLNPDSPTFKQEVLPSQAIGMSEFEKAHIPILQQGANAATANATNAAARLNFDKAKVQYERENPGFQLEKVEQPDGSVQFVGVNKKTLVASPVMTAPAAAPTGANRGPVGVTDTTAGVPLVGAAKNAQTTEGERKAATLLQRLQFSQGQLMQALKEKPDADKPGLFASAVGKLSTTGENLLNSAERQRVQAAQLDILDAALTLGTGAAYTKEQLEGYRTSYFPAYGDDPKTILDKQARLKNVIEAAKTAAGRAAKLVPAAPAAAGGGSAREAADKILGL
jgi:hypothetical protein